MNADPSKQLSAFWRFRYHAFNVLNEAERGQLHVCFQEYRSTQDLRSMFARVEQLLDTPVKRKLLNDIVQILPLVSNENTLALMLSESPKPVMAPSALGSTPTLVSPLSHLETPATWSAKPAVRRHSLVNGYAMQTYHGEIPPVQPKSVSRKPNDLLSITIKKPPTQPLGINIRGGAEFGLGIFVTLVATDTPAEAAGLRIGDQLLEVNGHSFENIQSSTAAKFLGISSTSATSMTLVVHRLGVVPRLRFTKGNISWFDVKSQKVLDAADGSQTEGKFVKSSERKLNIVLAKDTQSKQALGINIRGGSEYGLGIYVSKVDDKGPAAKKGMRVGDQILECNGVNFENVTHSQAVKFLKAQRHLVVRVKNSGRFPLCKQVFVEYSWVGQSEGPTTSAGLRATSSLRYGTLESSGAPSKLLSPQFPGIASRTQSLLNMPTSSSFNQRGVLVKSETLRSTALIHDSDSTMSNSLTSIGTQTEQSSGRVVSYLRDKSNSTVSKRMASADLRATSDRSASERSESTEMSASSDEMNVIKRSPTEEYWTTPSSGEATLVSETESNNDELKHKANEEGIRRHDRSRMPVTARNGPTTIGSQRSSKRSQRSQDDVLMAPRPEFDTTASDDILSTSDADEDTIDKPNVADHNKLLSAEQCGQHLQQLDDVVKKLLSDREIVLVKKHLNAYLQSQLSVQEMAKRLLNVLTNERERPEKMLVLRYIRPTLRSQQHLTAFDEVVCDTEQGAYDEIANRMDEFSSDEQPLSDELSDYEDRLDVPLRLDVEEDSQIRTVGTNGHHKFTTATTIFLSPSSTSVDSGLNSIPRHQVAGQHRTHSGVHSSVQPLKIDGPSSNDARNQPQDVAEIRPQAPIAAMLLLPDKPSTQLNANKTRTNVTPPTTTYAGQLSPEHGGNLDPSTPDIRKGRVSPAKNLKEHQQFLSELKEAFRQKQRKLSPSQPGNASLPGISGSDRERETQQVTMESYEGDYRSSIKNSALSHIEPPSPVSVEQQSRNLYDNHQSAPGFGRVQPIRARAEAARVLRPKANSKRPTISEIFSTADVAALPDNDQQRNVDVESISYPQWTPSSTMRSAQLIKSNNTTLPKPNNTSTVTGVRPRSASTHETEFKRVLIPKRRNNEALGISVSGGIDSKSQPEVRIETIFEDGAAAKMPQLKPGMRILMVDGVSLEGATHSQAVNVIRKAYGDKNTNKLLIVVQDDSV